MDRTVRIEHHTSIGMLWIVAWLFTIGYLDLSFWRGVLAFFVWPYFLGAYFAEPAPPPGPPQI